MKSTLLVLFISMLAFFTSCRQEPSQLKLSPLFDDAMVLQHKSNVAIWGTALPGSSVKIDGSWGKSAVVEVNQDSTWMAKIETPEAGGPYELTVQNADSMRIIKDVLIGEVWLCSGQSNMEMPLKGWPPRDTINNSKGEIANANYPQIRMFTVVKKFASKPEQNPAGSWQICKPENAANFSATAYFFGRKLHKELNVPIGLIHSSWGGTPVEAWIKGDKLIKDEDYTSLKESLPALEKATADYKNWLEKHKSIQFTDNEWNKLIRENAFSDSILSKTDCDDSKWPIMNLPGLIESTGINSIDGVFWFRKEIEIPANWAGKELDLHLGPIDDMDWTYFNGQLVGSTAELGFYNVPRNYKIPADIVKAGKAVIAVRVLDTGGGGGLYGNGHKISLDLNSKSISLENEWKYSVAAELLSNQYYLYDIAKNELLERPKLSMAAGPNTPTMLYNGMIAPLLPYTVKGAIWYQGESNVGRSAQYSRIFPMMIENWREDFENPEMPFYFVQIAPYNYGNEDKSAAARLRDAQRRTLSLKNTGMAVTLDISDLGSIHPGNKQDVGKRLALWALAKDYGKETVYSGPLYSKMEVVGNQLKLTFENADGGLVLKPEKSSAFKIAGPDGVYYDAEAKIEGTQVILTSSKVAEPIAARYAFYEYSTGVLFNGEGLPASSFTTEDILKD